MPLNIDVYQDVTPTDKSLTRLIWWRIVLWWVLPWPLRFAVQHALAQLIHFQNRRNCARYLGLIEQIWGRWQQRQSDPAFQTASELLQDGWRLYSDWPLTPHRRGQIFFSVKLLHPVHGGEDGAVFLWDSGLDSPTLPVMTVYTYLGLNPRSTEEELQAWESCFWLAFLTEEAMYEAAQRSR